MEPKLLLNEGEIARALERLAYEIIERHNECNDVLIVGIERRGADLGRRMAAILSGKLGHPIAVGSLDINLYRDDWTSKMQGQPAIGTSYIPGDVTDKALILVDDVLYTGRTIRSALEAINDYGRPRCIELLVLVDRGHRELPIQADYVGRSINTSRAEHVDVMLSERDGKDEVMLSRPEDIA